MRDGVSARDREALVTNLAPVVVIDAAFGKEASMSGSMLNEQESKVIVKTIGTMLLKDISPESIGVIALCMHCII